MCKKLSAVLLLFVFCFNAYAQDQPSSDEDVVKALNIVRRFQADFTENYLEYQKTGNASTPAAKMLSVLGTYQRVENKKAQKPLAITGVALTAGSAYAILQYLKTTKNGIEAQEAIADALRSVGRKEVEIKLVSFFDQSRFTTYFDEFKKASMKKDFVMQQSDKEIWEILSYVPKVSPEVHAITDVLYWNNKNIVRGLRRSADYSDLGIAYENLNEWLRTDDTKIVALKKSIQNYEPDGYATVRTIEADLKNFVDYTAPADRLYRLSSRWSGTAFIVSVMAVGIMMVAISSSNDVHMDKNLVQNMNLPELRQYLKKNPTQLRQILKLAADF